MTQLQTIKPYLTAVEFAELVPLVEAAEQQAAEIYHLRRLIAEGASLSEVAASLDCSTATVRQLERIALTKCRRQILNTKS